MTRLPNQYREQTQIGRRSEGNSSSPPRLKRYYSLVFFGLLGMVQESPLQQHLEPLPALQHECAFLPRLVFFLQQFMAPGWQQFGLLQQAALLSFWGVPMVNAAAEIAKLVPQTMAITMAFIFLIGVSSWLTQAPKRLGFVVWAVSLSRLFQNVEQNLLPPAAFFVLA